MPDSSASIVTAQFTQTPHIEPTSTRIPNVHTPLPQLISTQIPAVLSQNLEIGSTYISEKDDMTLVFVPEGEFKMGSEEGSDEDKPAHTVYLDAFWIDKTVVSNVQYKMCVESGTCTAPYSIRSQSGIYILTITHSRIIQLSMLIGPRQIHTASG